MIGVNIFVSTVTGTEYIRVPLISKYGCCSRRAAAAFFVKGVDFLNIITRASVKERIHVEQIIRSQPHMHNSSLVDIVTIPVRKCLGLSMDVYKPVGEVKEPLPIILDVHGGGLIAGRKEQNRNLGIQLARRGYIVFIPDYRLVPETDIFGQISDILDALAVIEAKAAEFGGKHRKTLRYRRQCRCFLGLYGGCFTTPSCRDAAGHPPP